MTLLAAHASLAQERPNIALILSDDQGWYGLSVQMHPDLPNSRSDFFHTPRLEELASQGMRFSDAYAPSPACSPTRLSIQNGMNPATNRRTKAEPIATAINNFPLVPPNHAYPLVIRRARHHHRRGPAGSRLPDRALWQVAPRPRRTARSARLRRVRRAGRQRACLELG